MGDVAALTWPLCRPGLGPALLLGPPRGARRCLFGSVDHEKTKSMLDEECKRQLRADKERWNFDFETDRPLPDGRYEWREADNGASDKDDADSTLQRTAEENAQTRITDFMRKRKLSSNQKTNDFVSPKSKSCRRSST